MEQGRGEPRYVRCGYNAYSAVGVRRSHTPGKPQVRYCDSFLLSISLFVGDGNDLNLYDARLEITFA